MADKGRRPQLSAREMRVLAWVADGLQDSEIGAKLGLTRDTVKSHMKRIYTACGVRNRAEAVAWGYRNRVLGSGMDGRGLPGDCIREFAAGLRPGAEALAHPSPLWRDGYKAGVAASSRVALAQAAELDKAAALAASEVPDA